MSSPLFLVSKRSKPSFPHLRYELQRVLAEEISRQKHDEINHRHFGTRQGVDVGQDRHPIVLFLDVSNGAHCRCDGAAGAREVGSGKSVVSAAFNQTRLAAGALSVVGTRERERAKANQNILLTYLYIQYRPVRGRN